MRRAIFASFVVVLAVACSSSPTTTATSSAPATSAAAATPAPTTAPTAAPSTARPATPPPGPAFEDATFTGPWTNTTFGSTGTATMAVKIDRTAFTLGLTLSVTGNVFGAPPPAPETFTLPITAAGATFSGKSKTFGDVTAALKADGTVTFKGENIPGGRVKTIDGTGTWTTQAINLTYNVALSDGSTAKGTVALKRS
jgi:hypothetical protein